MTKARVALIGTGGTISSIGRDSLDVWEYMDTARKAEPDELLQRFPEVPAAAEIVPVKYRAVGSTAIGPADWLALVTTVHDALAREAPLGSGIRANGLTEYDGTSCATLQNGDLVKVEGQPLGDGTIVAREVTRLTGAAPVDQHHAPGVTVRLVDSTGAVAASGVTDNDGKFEFRDTAPGGFELTAQLHGIETPCAPPLASDIELVARQNQVRGRST